MLYDHGWLVSPVDALPVKMVLHVHPHNIAEAGSTALFSVPSKPTGTLDTWKHNRFPDHLADRETFPDVAAEVLHGFETHDFRISSRLAHVIEEDWAGDVGPEMEQVQNNPQTKGVGVESGDLGAKIQCGETLD